MHDPVTDTSVLDDILEEWEDLSAAASELEPVTFPAAVSSHYKTIKGLLNNDGTSDELKEMLAREVTIIEGWLDQFAEMRKPEAIVAEAPHHGADGGL